MKLLFKERFFSWFDSFDVFDEEGSTVFTVQGQLSWGHCLQIYDTQGNHVGTVKEQVITFLPKFAMYIGDECIGEIKKELTFLKPKYTLSCNDWVVDGDFWEWDYSVTDADGRLIMTAAKELMHLTDVYEVEVVRREDVLYSLMIVLAIDAAKCSSRS